MDSVMMFSNGRYTIEDEPEWFTDGRNETDACCVCGEDDFSVDYRIIRGPDGEYGVDLYSALGHRFSYLIIRERDWPVFYQEHMTKFIKDNCAIIANSKLSGMADDIKALKKAFILSKIYDQSVDDAGMSSSAEKKAVSAQRKIEAMEFDL